MSTSPTFDPQRPWAVEEAPLPAAGPVPAGAARVMIEAVVTLLIAGALAWAAVLTVRVGDFVSASCNLLACPGYTVNEHFRMYGEALVGAIGVVYALRTAWRGIKLLRGHGHLAHFRRGLVVTMVLLAAWSVLLSAAPVT